MMNELNQDEQVANSKVYKILVINPGSTSTKVAVYENEKSVHLCNIRHTPEQLDQFDKIVDQLDFRQQVVIDWLNENHIPMDFDAVIGRGGLSKPLPGGVYLVNSQMCKDTYHAMRMHVCNLGCIIAFEIAKMQKNPCNAYIADPGVVDELIPEARISGSPLMPRVSIWHALNQRAIARRYAAEIDKTYEDLNLIICHLGGGISVAAHRKGKAIDANNALDGEGTFSPERAGTLPAADLIHLCFSGKYTEDQLLKRVSGQAGLKAYLGTTDIPKIIESINAGDEHARLLLNAMLYHTSKQIASESAVLMGKVDAILLTGGMAYSDYVTQYIIDHVGFIAPVYIYPGEDEMKALAQNALAVLRGEREANPYT